MTPFRSFTPVADSAARVLILGRMPGVESLRAGQYFAHSRNAFWRIMDDLFNAGPNMSYNSLMHRLLKAGLLLWGNPFATSVIGYIVSSTAVIGAKRLRHGGSRAITRQVRIWLALNGTLSGAAMALMYSALAFATVSSVVPVIAAYPLVTVMASALLLRGENPGSASLPEPFHRCRDCIPCSISHVLKNPRKYH